MKSDGGGSLGLYTKNVSSLRTFVFVGKFVAAYYSAMISQTDTFDGHRGIRAR